MAFAIDAWQKMFGRRIVVGVARRQRVPHWVSRRFERKHSGFHRGVLVAVPASLALWLAGLLTLGIIH